MKSFRELAEALAKPGEGIIAQLTPEKADLWHGATGVSGEAGELLDAVKKHVVYNKPLDLVNVIEELGDLRFYMAVIQNSLGITDDQILGYNNTKLGERYASGGYSDQQAQARADKAE